MNYLRLTIALSTGILLIAGCSNNDRTNADNSPTAAALEKTQDLTVPQSEAFANLTAARKLAWDAAVMVQHPPHPVDTWQQARVKWRQAIRLLETIPPGAPEAKQVQAKLTVYRINYAAISDRLTAETKATDALQNAQTLAWQAAVTVQKPPHALKTWQRASSKWQEAIAILDTIPATTSIAPQSQAKLAIYRSNYTAINQRIATETQALLTLKQFSAVAAKLSSLPDNIYLSNLTLEQIGVSYEDYTRLVQELQQAFDRFASEPDAKNHVIYPVLAAAIEDYQTVLKLWKVYLDFKSANTQWLYDDVFNQLVPISLPDVATLVQKYDVKTYADGTKVSLRFTAWAIWQKASQRVRQAQQKVLSLDNGEG